MEDMIRDPRKGGFVHSQCDRRQPVHLCGASRVWQACLGPWIAKKSYQDQNVGVSATLLEPRKTVCPHTEARLQLLVSSPRSLDPSSARRSLSRSSSPKPFNLWTKPSTVPHSLLITCQRHPSSSLDFLSVPNLLKTLVNSGQWKPSGRIHPRKYKQRFSRLRTHPKISSLTIQMAKTKQTAKKSTEGKPPRKELVAKTVRKRSGNPLPRTNPSPQSGSAYTSHITEPQNTYTSTDLVQVPTRRKSWHSGTFLTP